MSVARLLTGVGETAEASDEAMVKPVAEDILLAGELGMLAPTMESLDEVPVLGVLRGVISLR